MLLPSVLSEPSSPRVLLPFVFPQYFRGPCPLESPHSGGPGLLGAPPRIKQFLPHPNFRNSFFPGPPLRSASLCQLPGPLWGPLVCSLHLSLPAFLSDKQRAPVAECLSFGAGEGRHSVLGSLSVASAIYSLRISGPGVMFLPLSAAVV